jgi:hypothetical protein
VATEREGCEKALGTHVWESFKDFGERVREEPGVEDVHLVPLRTSGDLSSIAMSISRKGDADDSSIEFICTDTGGVVVAAFIRGAPVEKMQVPAILTREGVDAIVARFIASVFK